MPPFNPLAGKFRDRGSFLYGARGDFGAIAAAKKKVTKAAYVPGVKGAVALAVPVVAKAAPLLGRMFRTASRAVMGIAARTPIVRDIVPKKVVVIGRAVPTAEVARTTAAAATAGFLAQDIGQAVGGPVGGAISKVGGVVSGVTIGALKVADIVIPGKGIPLIETGLKLRKDPRSFIERQGGRPMGHPAAGTSLATRQPLSMGVMPESNAIVRSWHANGVNFWRTVDGWIYVQRLDGTIKRYRPYKSVVLGKRPSSRQVKRAIRKLKGEAKIYRELTNLFKR